ncbi:MAG: anti-sigma factor antagonist [Ignavibacteria bacterium]|nr:anti-sigma factor antagonist [Ignavibacteria bacterium]
MKFHNQTQHGRRYEISSRFAKSDEKPKAKLKFKSKGEEEEIEPEEIAPVAESVEPPKESADSKILKTFKFLQNKEKEAEEEKEEVKASEKSAQQVEQKPAPLFIRKKPLITHKLLPEVEEEEVKKPELKLPDIKKVEPVVIDKEKPTIENKIEKTEEKALDLPEVTEEAGLDLKVDTIYTMSNDIGYGDYFGSNDDASIPDFYSDNIDIAIPVEEDKSVKVEPEKEVSPVIESEPKEETPEAQADMQEEVIAESVTEEEIESAESDEFFTGSSEVVEFSTSSFESEEREDFSKDDFINKKEVKTELKIEIPKIEPEIEKPKVVAPKEEIPVAVEKEPEVEVHSPEIDKEEARLALQKELEELNIEEFSFSGSKNAKFNKSMYSDITIISVNLDTSTVEDALEFKEYMMTTINTNAKKIIVDLSETDYIDSTFLGALVASLKKITAKKGELRLVCNQKMISMLFIIAGMDKIFKIYQDLNEAITSFKE